MPRRTDAYRGLAQPSRLSVMHELLARPGQSLAELAEATGLHENTLRDHLRVLETEGFVVRVTEHRGTRGRPRDLFEPAGPENPIAAKRIEDAKRHGDLMRSVLLHEDADATEEVVAHQLDALYEHLDDVGLEPRIDEDALTVKLAPCAFHDLVADRLPILCHVHEELVRGVLSQAGGPLEVGRLLPLVTPHECRLLLQRRDAAPLGDATAQGEATPDAASLDV
ncbi:helix-turn-helix domain-containing protein [Microbacterium sp. NPDC019599]|uniref:helix-turn-helix domain-containing protein n=1 Tax=Microbacterium sp. NPDC019599 TaxID=3154690 RepID=UPI0033E9BF79